VSCAECRYNKCRGAILQTLSQQDFFADFFAEKSLGQEIICFDESLCLGTSGQDKVLESGECTIKLFTVVIYGFS
jgi:hypothetical protein